MRSHFPSFCTSGCSLSILLEVHTYTSQLPTSMRSHFPSFCTSGCSWSALSYMPNSLI